VGKGRFRVRWFEACVAVADVLAFAALFPFREAFATASGVLLLATLVLFSSPGVLLAPDLQSARIPAYSAEADVVSPRGSLVLKVLPELKKRVLGRIEVPQGSLDVRNFFYDSTLEKRMEILRRNEVDYVMIPDGSPLVAPLQRLPDHGRYAER
jgi:hypothetical protein